MSLAFIGYVAGWKSQQNQIQQTFQIQKNPASKDPSCYLLQTA